MYSSRAVNLHLLPLTSSPLSSSSSFSLLLSFETWLEIHLCIVNELQHYCENIQERSTTLFNHFVPCYFLLTLLKILVSKAHVAKYLCHLKWNFWFFLKSVQRMVFYELSIDIMWTKKHFVCRSMLKFNSPRIFFFRNFSMSVCNFQIFPLIQTEWNYLYAVHPIQQYLIMLDEKWARKSVHHLLWN